MWALLFITLLYISSHNYFESEPVCVLVDSFWTLLDNLILS